MIQTTITGQQELSMPFTRQGIPLSINFSDHAIVNAQEQGLDLYLVASTILLAEDTIFENPARGTYCIYDSILGISILMSPLFEDGLLSLNVITNNNYIPTRDCGKPRFRADYFCDVNAIIY